MKKRARKSTRVAPKIQQRTYQELASVGGGINSDWNLDISGEDSLAWQYSWLLTSRVRDLARCNPTFQRYRDLIWAGVFGPEGIRLRSKIKETEDRVIQSPDEKAAIRAYDARWNNVAKWTYERAGAPFSERKSMQEFGTNGSRVAQIKIGAPDVYACLQIEKAWHEWKRAEFCDVRGTRTYDQIRQLRLWSAIRDGDCFLHMIRDPRVNKFGFSLRLINAEWVDRFYNGTLSNGDQVRMGIRYKNNAWGLGKPVSYFFIKRQPNDWQYSIPGVMNTGQGTLHDEVPADEVIHYARPVDADGTRPSPWLASAIPTSRQLDQYAIAEVVAARAQACKIGWLHSTVVPEGGVPTDIDPRKAVPKTELTPGAIVGLPYGVEYTESDPKHPNGNFEAFRKAILRHQSAGMPGASYSELSNDYESISFSAGRLQRLSQDNITYLIQKFDIESAERPIFETWLEMALTVGAIPLPLTKFDKFKSAHFQGPRTPGVDEIKEVTAAALRVANHFSSDQKECDKFGVDFEETLFEQAEANMLKEQLGVNPQKTVESPPPAETPADGEGDGETDKPEKKPEKKALANSRLTV